MTVVRELVTILRYQLDKSGLSEYLSGAGATAKQAAKQAKWFANEVRLGAKDAIEEWREMPPTVDRATRAQHRLNDAAKQHGDVVKRTTDGYLNLRRLATLTAGVFSARYALRASRNTIELASRHDELGVVMETVGRNAGYTADELASVEQSLMDTGISAIGSREAIAGLIASKIDLAHASDLARVAQDAAVIGNLNSTDAFNRMSDGISTGNTLTLRTLGLNVDFQKSYDALAKSLGKSTKQLSEQEKVQARVNAVMELAPAIAGAYEASMTNAGKQMRSAVRYAEDMRVKLGKALQPAYAKAVFAYADGLKLAAQYTTEILHTIGLIGASWGLVRARTGFLAIQAGISESAGAAVGLRGVIAAIGKAGWVALLPYLRMAALLAGMYLIGEDIATWWRGGHSLLGELIGEKETFQGTFDFIENTIESIKSSLGEVDLSTGQWLRKWGAVALAAYALWRILRPIRRELWAVAGFLLPLIVKELRLIATTPLGRFLSIWLGAVLALKWMYDNADKIAEKIRSAFDGALGRIGERLDELKEKLANLVPDSVKDYFKENLGGNFLSDQTQDLLDHMNQRYGGAIQQPQSFSRSSDSTINQDITINAPTNNPASLARMAGSEVGRQTSRAINRGYVMPNVEAMA